MTSCAVKNSSATIASSSNSSSRRSNAVNESTPSAGLLTVEILGARHLPPAVPGSLLKWTTGYSNPYVVLTLDRERFVSNVKNKELFPVWKETARLKVPLPSETELLQTAGRSNITTAAMKGKGQSPGNRKAGVLTPKKTGTAVDIAMGYRQYHPCAPELFVQIFHRTDETKHAEAIAAMASNASMSAHVSALGPNDKLIGALVVPLLPCIMSSASSSRGWYQLMDEESQGAGQLQLSLGFDVSAATNELEPQKGDIVRLTGFGGLEYYSKILPPSAKLEVVDIFQDQVFAQTRSQEGWPLSFELHRNLVHVEHRPSLFLNASEQLQNQVTRVRQFRVVTGAQRVWCALPETSRIHFENSAAFVAFFGAQAYSTMRRSVQDLLRSGVYSGVQTFVASSKDAYGQVKHEFVRAYWSRPRRVTSGYLDGGYDDDLIDCGPRTNRGHIVRAFTASDRLAADDEEHAEDVMTLGWKTYEDSEDDGSYDKVDRDEGELAVPEQLICPITGCPMLDPVVAADGHSYEREAILQWFATSDMSPMTGVHMPTTQVFSNFTLRQLSEEVQAASTRRQQNKRRHRRHGSGPAQLDAQGGHREVQFEDKAASSEGCTSKWACERA
uniref:U-box domain-containing protein n=1 Tax=Peronospora matthiolae TaxID=2874970 RepID=A0AAV1T8C4_9STRA